jgi:uncharacterized small protein (DUF1192 family)
LDKSIESILDLMGVPEINRLNDRIAALEAENAKLQSDVQRWMDDEAVRHIDDVYVDLTLTPEAVAAMEAMRVAPLAQHLARIAALESQLEAARELLREAEWDQQNGDEPMCGFCGGLCDVAGHQHDCRLAAFLKEADDET